MKEATGELKTLTETTTSHEDNINNLNRVLEDHIKTSKDIETKMFYKFI